MVRELGYKFLQSWASAALQTAQRSPNISILWEAFIIQIYFCENFHSVGDIYHSDLFFKYFSFRIVFLKSFIIQIDFCEHFHFVGSIYHSDFCVWKILFNWRHLSFRFIYQIFSFCEKYLSFRIVCWKHLSFRFIFVNIFILWEAFIIHIFLWETFIIQIYFVGSIFHSDLLCVKYY